jgi:hypothetical protein
MADNRFIKKIITLLLILVFSQKMGLGLYLHNWLHANKSHATASTPLTNEELKYACSCISDFTAPLAETAVLELPEPLYTIYVPVGAPVITLPVVYKYFHSLRGPPALIALPI